MNKRQKKKRAKLESLYEGWDNISWKAKRRADKDYKRYCDYCRTHIAKREDIRLMF